VERWKKTDEIPGRVMVWTAAQCGAFLDSIENDRLYAAYHLAAYWGLRRSELEHLEWPDVDLATRRIHVRGDVKSEDSDRIITIDSSTARCWRHGASTSCLSGWNGMPPGLTPAGC
jgi:hypothetical protein